MAKYRNPAIKDYDRNTGEPIGDLDLIMFFDQQQTLRDNVYPSQADLDSFNDNFGSSFSPKSTKYKEKEVRKVAEIKRKKYTRKEKAAYWAGAGLATSAYGDQNALLNNSNSQISNSARAGFNAARSNNLISKAFKK